MRCSISSRRSTGSSTPRIKKRENCSRISSRLQTLSDATMPFILVGVKEVKGGRSEVLGVNTQLDDASLQQFVNSKTRRAVEFSYRAMELDGRPIAVIHIPVQYRPVYLKSDFGKLRKGLVYLRRGSSTAVATPEEIARMGADRPVASAREPSLTLSVFERGTGQLLGDEMALRSTVLRVPPKKDIPNLTGRGYVSLIPINSDYYRELAAFTRITQLMKPVSFAVMNRGGVSAHDVRLVFEVDDPGDRYVFEDASNFPEPPERQHEIRPLKDVLSARTKYDVSVERTSWNMARRVQLRKDSASGHGTARRRSLRRRASKRHVGYPRTDIRRQSKPAAASHIRAAH